MTAFISPFRDWVFVDTPLEVFEQRDPKGLYKKARSEQLPNMTGINSPYEAPENPSTIVDTAQADLNKSVANLLTQIAADRR